MATQASFAEWYRHAYGCFPQEHRAAGASGAEMFFVEQNTHDTVDEMGDYHCLALISRWDNSSAIFDFGEGPKHTAISPGSLSFQPASSSPRIIVEGRPDVMGFTFPDRAISTLLGDAAPSRGSFDVLTQNAAFFGRELRHLVASLWDTAANDGPMAGLKIDGLFQLLIVRLVELSGQALKTTTAGLSQDQIAKAFALIEDRLDEGLSLPEIADEVGVSHFYFARCFKAQTGDTPHGYVMERRLDRAKDALQDRHARIADIAYACGFSSQQHMTTAFSKHLGVTPARYRKAVAA